jgi:hypothetical protein
VECSEVLVVLAEQSHIEDLVIGGVLFGEEDIHEVGSFEGN